MEINKYYHNWVYADLIYRSAYSDDLKMNYQMRSAIETFLLGLENFPDQLEKHFDEMEWEIKKWGIPANMEIIRFLWQKRAGNVVDYGYEPVFLDRGVKYGYMETFVSAERMQILRKIGSDAEVAAVLVRYESIFANTQHWNVPTGVYKRLVEDYGVDTEGFSSPLNSQLLKLSFPFEYFDNKGVAHKSAAVIKNPKICTLFGDTDEPFGSMGSFLEADLVGRKISCFIPYVKSLTDLIVDKILKTLAEADKRKKNTLFIFGCPNTPFLDFYKKAAESKYLKLLQNFKVGEYWFENVDQRMPTNFPADYMFLANYELPVKRGLVY
jgi:hypothetical protein